MLIAVPAVIVAVVAGVLVALNIGSPLNPAVSAVKCNPDDLVSCLIQPPAGATKGSSAWSTSTTVDTAAYSTAYPDSAATQQPSEVASLVTDDGLKGIAHRSWIQGTNQIDLILLRFASPQGAQAWADDRTGDFLALGGGAQLSVPQIAGAKGYVTPTADSAGDVDARLVATAGDIDLEVHYGSQGTMQQQDFSLWAGTQYTSLQTAPAVTPSPSPTATTFQVATCPGSLTSCLMPFPAGGQTLPGVPSTYTASSYANDFITKADAQAVSQRMQADNVVTIDSESWGVNGFNGDGQLVLVQTRTPSQAQDLFSYISGAANFPTTFSVPGYTSADARYSPNADSNGFFNGVISFQTGNVYMTLWLNFTNSFDVSTAQSWAVQELNLLTQNTQNHWGFPIPQVSTPSLPAFSPGTCPSAGLTGCLITTPSGSTAGTSGGGASVRDIAVSDFADAVFADRQGYELAWLTADGAKDAATESWTDANGAAATDYVLRFGSSRQAQAAALQMTGDSLEGSQSCSVLSLPNLTCMVLPQNDNNGQVPIRIVAWSGPYELDLEFTQTDKADTADALTWAQAQLQMLAGG